jgi:hypothetical protein
MQLSQDLMHSVGSRNHAQWAHGGCQQTAQCSRHPCFGCTSADAFLPDRFDSCSVNELQRQLYLRDERLWGVAVTRARFMASSRRV